MRIFQALALLAILISMAFPKSYKMNIKMKGGGTTSIEISDIKKITFSNLTNIEDIKLAQNVLHSFKLLQNYPNPFNPSTRISYDLPKAGKVRLDIFDINGRLVKTLLETEQAEGSHFVIWNGSDSHSNRVANGTYFYRVTFNESFLVRKMLLIK